MSETDDLHARLNETNRLIARGHTVEEALRRTAVSRPLFFHLAQGARRQCRGAARHPAASAEREQPPEAGAGQALDGAAPAHKAAAGLFRAPLEDRLAGSTPLTN